VDSGWSTGPVSRFYKVEHATAQRLGSARVGRLATVGADGRPHIVPCCFALEGTKLYSAVDAKPKSTFNLRRIRNVRSSPLAALLVDEYVEDWAQLWWIRVDGAARVLEDGTEYDHAIELLVDKYEQYRRQRPQGPVIAIDIATWRSWP
jgi:PPOX class probable F420-dependent enzyme